MLLFSSIHKNKPLRSNLISKFNQFLLNSNSLSSYSSLTPLSLSSSSSSLFNKNSSCNNEFLRNMLVGNNNCNKKNQSFSSSSGIGYSKLILDLTKGMKNNNNNIVVDTSKKIYSNNYNNNKKIVIYKMGILSNDAKESLKTLSPEKRKRLVELIRKQERVSEEVLQERQEKIKQVKGQLPYVLIFIVFVLPLLASLTYAFLQSKWPTVKGIIVDIEKNPSNPNEYKSVTYRYRVWGRLFHHTQPVFKHRINKGKQEPYSIGQEIEIHINSKKSSIFIIRSTNILFTI
eukprot:TRINITY_DN576_c2_g1_i1.p1 TRINITY_DN576_c2_g1~~TRINITY_DN576_c2_g1_i1.p1  ORF type:complete len:288 (+),score=59.87 TRINITY_DN576_c2_g1_i1:48-911(+)